MLFNSYPGPPQPPPQFQQQQFSSSFSAQVIFAIYLRVRYAMPATDTTPTQTNMLPRPQSAGAPVYAQAPNSANPGNETHPKDDSGNRSNR